MKNYTHLTKEERIKMAFWIIRKIQCQEYNRNMEKYGLSMILPKEIRENFVLVDVKETETEWILTVEEKKDLIPEAAKQRDFGQGIVLNGYRDTLN